MRLAVVVAPLMSAREVKHLLTERSWLVAAAVGEVWESLIILEVSVVLWKGGVVKVVVVVSVVVVALKQTVEWQISTIVYQPQPGHCFMAVSAEEMMAVVVVVATMAAAAAVKTVGAVAAQVILEE